MSKSSEFFYNSCGAGRIHAIEWEPDVPAKGIVQIVHGISEHTGRYTEFAEFLNSLGYLVVAEDHMGHGKSAGTTHTPGYFHGGWMCAVGDTYHLLKTTKEKYPDLPYILFGHSMGSFLSRSILIRYPDCGIEGCILCGTGWFPKPILKIGISTAKLFCRLQGESAPSSRLQTMAFAGYNRKVEHKRTAFDWLSRDSGQVDRYIADPMCGFTASAGLLRDMFSGALFNEQTDNLRKMKADLPVYFIAGEGDPVGDYGAGVWRTVQNFRSVGMKDVICKLYPLCRHELLNEINRSEIQEDVSTWIAYTLGDTF